MKTKLRTPSTDQSSRSPPHHLSPVEHIWDNLGRKVGHPTSLNELEARLQKIWKEMSQDILQNLDASMPDRIASYIRAREGSTEEDEPTNLEQPTLNHVQSDTMASAVFADPTRALQGTNRGSGMAMEESENYVGSLEQLLLRKYSSNQHKKSKSTEELLLNSVESASRRKIKIPDLLKEREQDSQNGNIIVELDLLSSLMKNLLCCKYCCSSEKIELREDLKIPRGLAVSLEIICHNCGESKSTMSSKISNKCNDVNLKLTYGMRAIGKGGAAARIFCGLRNLPPPPVKFERHNSLFLNVLKQLVKTS
ncbi:uncharacterized protein TNCV_3123571 [Trichonephila clavipes]|nr:uncharacterized protein TNCV_3123571 [Trichonephila clavipes]